MFSITLIGFNRFHVSPFKEKGIPCRKEKLGLIIKGKLNSCVEEKNSYKKKNVKEIGPIFNY